MWYRFCRFISKCMYYWPFRPTIYGRENVPDEGPLLILSNHQSFLDPSMCQGPVDREFYFVARHTLFDGLLGKFFYSIHCLPVNREKPDLSTMKKTLAILKGGGVICLYPEATRTRDGRIGEIKPGFGFFARRSGATIIPTAIEGAFECWPRTKKFPSLGPVVVSYGEPIPAETVKQMGDVKFAAYFTDILQKLHNDCRRKMGREPFDYPALESIETSEDQNNNVESE